MIIRMIPMYFWFINAWKDGSGFKDCVCVSTARNGGQSNEFLTLEDSVQLCSAWYPHRPKRIKEIVKAIKN